MLSANEPFISEFLANNKSALADEDGDYSDWIEIHNPTVSSVSLNGWYLTDNRGNLTKWQFPNVSIPAGGYQVVFASDKNRRNPSAPLHTNFKLDAEGDYLALVKPDRTIANEFQPTFPAQPTDVSYGLLTETKFVHEGSLGDFLVPTTSDVTSLTTWKNSNFMVDSHWRSVTAGVGFGLANPGFNVRMVDVDGGGNHFIDSASEAETVINGNFAPNEYIFGTDVSSMSSVINFPSGGSFDGDLPYPNGNATQDLEDIIVRATATITIPAGNWMIGFGSDDGGYLRLGSNIRFTNVFNASNAAGTNEILYQTPRGHDWTVGQFTVPAGGITTTLDSLFYERGGGDSYEIAIRQGFQDNHFINSNWQLLSNGTFDWTVSTADTAGAKTDVAALMKNINATSWLRLPFDASNVGAIETLRLQLRYNDGFVAYLNGTEIARRNAPNTLAVNSVATATRSVSVSRTPEIIDITAFKNLLVTGSNVLAIHGLNVSSGNSTFIIAPELVASGLNVSPAQFFSTPTPGTANQQGFVDQVKDTNFSVKRGFFETPFIVSITTATTGATIRYTTDGSAPSETNGTTYSTPLTVSQTTVLRARAFKPGFDPSDVDTQTYLFLADVIHQSPNEETPPGFPDTRINNQDIDYGIDPDVVNDPTYGPQLQNALKELPTLSIVTDTSNLFDAATGIYVNSYNSGIAWERPTSVELINPDGSQGFQIDAGLRIRGGFSRSSDNPKHALRLFFRDQYGESKLHYPLFGQEGADEFDAVDLRTAQNYSWSFGGDPNYTFTRDIFSRDTQRDMGDPYTRGRYYHLYIDGQYWGLYQTQERSEADYGATYFGGQPEDYDVVKVEAGPYTINATDGNLDAWQRLWTKANAIASATTQASRYGLYQELQGLNADGTDNPASEVLLDVDNLIDYMNVIFYGGNLDAPISEFLGNNAPNNWYGIRSRVSRDGFRFFAHDSEHTLLNRDQDRTGPFPAGSDFERSSPQWIHQQLMFVDEYRLRFADRVQELFFNNGLLTPQVAAARMQQRATELTLPVIAESARWGDSKRNPGEAPLTQADWLSRIDYINNEFFPQRTANVLAQYKVAQLPGNEGLGALYPSLAPPDFNIQGGQVARGFTLRMSAPVGQIYYTLDGSDPRLPGGAISPTAQIFNSSISTTSLIARGAAWKYRDIGDQGTSWREAAFNDSSWSSGNAQLGYGDGDETTVVNYGSSTANKFVTTYFRKAFNVANPAAVGQLTLHIQRDDGAVIYLNGQEIARTNMPEGDVSFGTPASGPADENTFYEYTIDPRLLIAGNNVLAVEVHQVTPESSDISFDADLIATAYTGSTIALNESQYLRTRTKNGATWSALNATRFFVNAAPSTSNLAITEVNYNPLPPTSAELAINATFNEDSFEFIELQNTGAQPLDLPGVRFTDGILFDFADSSITTLAPGQRISIVSNLSAFRARYGNGPLVAGEFKGSLSDNGEQITLLDRDGATLQDFSFDDQGSWPDRADGLGSSLELLSTTGDYNSGDNWRSSTEVGGSPSASGSGPIANIVINEVLTHTDLPQVDGIELFNPTSQAIDISGWFLSDTNGVYDKYRIPNGTVLQPLGFRVFNESQFNASGGSDPDDFRLDGAHGDNVWLVAATATGKLTQFIDHVDFGAAHNGESFGRWPDAGQSSTLPTRFYPMASLTLGAPNSGPRVGPLVISEIMYAPPTPLTGLADDLEFIEVFNPTNATVDLTNWRISGGIDFSFDAATLLPANGKLVIVPFNPTNPDNAAKLSAFRSAYGITASVALVGGYQGQLSDSGETIRLLRPDEPPLGEPLFIPGITEDAVDFTSAAPWPVAANAGGRSLTRRGPSLWGHDPASWSASLPSPGSVATAQTLVSLDGSGNLLVQDVAVNGQSNSITVDFVPATNSFSIRDSLRPVSFVTPTGVQVSANEVRLPKADITGSRLIVQAGAGNDSVTVDLTGGLGGLVLDVHGEGGADELLLSGSSTVVTYRATGLTTGEVLSDASVIDYDNFDFVTDTSTSASRRYEIDSNRFFGNVSLRIATDPTLATRTAISLPAVPTTAVTRFVTPTNVTVNPLTIAGGLGNDTLTAASLASNYTGVLVVLGNEGNDLLDATTLSNRVSLVGGSGNDQLIGGSGADTLLGGDGNDAADGRGGDDLLTGGTGADSLIGGTGTGDLVSEVTANDLTLSPTRLDIIVNNVTESDTLSSIERAQLLGSGLANRIDASTATIPVSIYGGAGNDTLNGGSQADVIDGQAGNDVVTGDGGSDTLNGGIGNDTLREAIDQNLTLGNTTLVAKIGTVTQTTDALTGFELADITGGLSRNRIDLSGFSASLGTTISGGGQSDTIIGSPGPDMIFTLTGADSVQGLGGADAISTGSGNDTISGGDGNDNLNGQVGDDSIFGDAGNDVIVGGAGIDTLGGGADNDFIAGQTEAGLLNGGDGNDTLQGNTLNDTLNGDAGDDQLLGLQGNDVLNGSDGADKLFGGFGNDTINGGAGSDSLTGDVGNDTFDGGPDSDRINEVLDGNVTITGTTITSAGLGTDTTSTIERFNILGGASANFFDARLSTVSVGFTGVGGNDTLLGGSKADVIDGGDGNDVLSGGGGNDLIEGGAGSDYVLEKADTNFLINGVTVTSTVTGIDAPTNVERIVLIGGIGANKLDATLATVPVVLIGGRGNDTLLGGNAADTLSGGNRNDATVVGGDGTDSLDGGAGNDTLENDPLDTKVTVAGDTLIADVFTLLPSWIDAL